MHAPALLSNQGLLSSLCCPRPKLSFLPKSNPAWLAPSQLRRQNLSAPSSAPRPMQPVTAPLTRCHTVSHVCVCLGIGNQQDRAVGHPPAALPVGALQDSEASSPAALLRYQTNISQQFSSELWVGSTPVLCCCGLRSRVVRVTRGTSALL